MTIGSEHRGGMDTARLSAAAQAAQARADSRAAALTYLQRTDNTDVAVILGLLPDQQVHACPACETPTPAGRTYCDRRECRRVQQGNAGRAAGRRKAAREAS